MVPGHGLRRGIGVRSGLVRLHQTVTYEDGTTVEVKTGPADVVAWEHEHRVGFGTQIGEGFSSWMWWLVWHALVRRQGETRTYEEWLDQVAETQDVPKPEADAGPPVLIEAASPDS